MSFSFSPKIITDGLVLYLDAANTRSYPGTGTTWSDLSRGGNNGTLENFNSPSPQTIFDPANGGSIIFDGTNDYVQVPNGYTNTLKNNNTWSVSFWFKANNLSNEPVLLSPETGQLNYFDLFLEVGNNKIYFAAGGGIGTNYLTNTTAITITTNIIYNIVFLKTGITTGKVYLNNNEVILSTIGTGLGAMPNIDADFRIGAFKQSGYFLNGNIYQVSIYNRALSAAEIQQNYNATKTRFGL